MRTRKIPISELRNIIDNLSVLHPEMTVNSHIDFDLLKTFHDMAITRHFVSLETEQEKKEAVW